MGAANFLNAAGAGLAVAGGVSEGIQKKTAAQIDSIRLKMAAEAGKVRAIQTDATFRENLNDVQSTMTAIRSSQNVGYDSPTSFALYDKAEEVNSNARKVAVSNERLKALGLEGDAAAAWQRGQSARNAGLFSSAGSVINSLARVSYSDLFK